MQAHLQTMMLNPCAVVSTTIEIPPICPVLWLWGSGPGCGQDGLWEGGQVWYGWGDHWCYRRKNEISLEARSSSIPHWKSGTNGNAALHAVAGHPPPLPGGVHLLPAATSCIPDSCKDSDFLLCCLGNRSPGGSEEGLLLGLHLQCDQSHGYFFD